MTLMDGLMLRALGEKIVVVRQQVYSVREQFRGRVRQTSIGGSLPANPLFLPFLHGFGGGESDTPQGQSPRSQRNLVPDNKEISGQKGDSKTSVVG